MRTSAGCRRRRVPRLAAQPVRQPGGNPRSVVRVLDSLRVYRPSLKDRIDLADLVWLRMIAVGSPNFYRWVDDYLKSFVALAGVGARRRGLDCRAGTVKLLPWVRSIN